MALGMTQAELGEKLRTDQTTVSAWEKNKTNLAGPSLVALAELLLTTPEALLTGEGFKVPEESISTQKLVICIGSEKRTVPLPPGTPEGHLTWIEMAKPGNANVLGEKEALAALKKALATRQKIWVVVE